MGLLYCISLVEIAIQFEIISYIMFGGIIFNRISRMAFDTAHCNPKLRPRPLWLSLGERLTVVNLN